MRYACVCSGISAPTVAWQPLGWRPVFFAEIEPFPSAVLAHHYPNVPNYGDMTRFKEWPDDAIDVLVGGTPCQSFSVAGLRKGLDDPRGNLALVFLALADRYRPEWVVWENVPGVLSSNGGRDFGAFLGGLGELGFGFAWRCLDAQWFGLAQRRKRVFVVGHLGDWRRAAAVLFEPEGLRGDSAPSREAGEGVARPIAGSSERSSGYRNDADTADNLVAHSLRGEGFDASEDGTGRGKPLVPVTAFPWQQGGSMGFNASDNLSGSLIKNQTMAVAIGGHDNSHANAGVMPAVTVALRGREGGGVAEIGGDLATALRASQGGGDKPHVLQTAVRRLTPRECERLQGFPDDFTTVPYRGKTASDGPRYKALGNSMAVPVLAWIGRRIALLRSTLPQREAAE